MKIDKLGSKRYHQARNYHGIHGIAITCLIGTIVVTASLLLFNKADHSIAKISSSTPSYSTSISSMENTNSSSAISATSSEVAISAAVSSAVVASISSQQSSVSSSPQTADEKMVALSYDDGPSSSLTPQLLKILKDNDCHVTFCVVGESAKRYPDIIKQEYEDGNQIANHSYDHKDFTTLSKDEMTSEITTTNNIIYNIINKYPTLFRPPYGSYNNTVKEVADCPLITWSIDSNDWRTNLSDDQVIDNIMSDLGDGKIILMHDIHDRTIKISPTVISKIKAEGYKIVSIEELCAAKGITMDKGKVYSMIKK